MHSLKEKVKAALPGHHDEGPAKESTPAGPAISTTPNTGMTLERKPGVGPEAPPVGTADQTAPPAPGLSAPTATGVSSDTAVIGQSAGAGMAGETGRPVVDEHVGQEGVGAPMATGVTGDAALGHQTQGAEQPAQDEEEGKKKEEISAEQKAKLLEAAKNHPGPKWGEPGSVPDEPPKRLVNQSGEMPHP